MWKWNQEVTIPFSKAIGLYFLVNVLMAILPAIAFSFLAITNIQLVLLNLIMIFGNNFFAANPFSFYFSLKVLAQESLVAKIRYSFMLLSILLIFGFVWAHAKVSLKTEVMKSSENQAPHVQVFSTMRHYLVLTDLISKVMTFGLIIPVVLLLDGLETKYIWKRKKKVVVAHKPTGIYR